MKIKEGKILNQLPLICIIRANTKHIQKPHLYEMPKHAVQSNSTRSEKKNNNQEGRRKTISCVEH